MEDDAGALPAAFDQWMESSRQLVSPATADAILTAALSDLAARAHKLMLHYHYTRVRRSPSHSVYCLMCLET